MKKMIALMLTLALALGLSAPALAYIDKNLEAPKAKDVVIDGDLSEWDLSRSAKIVDKSQIIDQIEHWDGEDDCAMEISVMWDEENLYFAITISDKDPFVYREGFPLDELDAFIIFLSTDPAADPDRTEYTASDWRWVSSVEDYYLRDIASSRFAGNTFAGSGQMSVQAVGTLGGSAWLGNDLDIPIDFTGAKDGFGLAQ